MINTLLVSAAVATAVIICFFALFYRFMRGWNAGEGSRPPRRNR